MIRIGAKAGTAVAAAWLATLIFAFLMGEGRRAVDLPHLEDEGSPQGSSLAHDRVTSRAGDFNETRKLGAQNRFVTFAQTLGGDELARILPEITDKMSLDQIQSTLRRLFDEVDPGPARRTARFELIRRWAQLNPEEALQHIATLDDPKMRHDLRLKGIEGWASIAPAAALAFALESEDELVAKSREAAWNGFATSRDLQAAFEFVPTLASDASPEKSWTVEGAVGALFQNDDLAVISWVKKLAVGPVRDQAMTGMVNQWARHDPEAAAQWIEEHADPENLDPMRELVKGLAAKSQ